MNTNSATEKLRRSRLLAQYDFTELALTPDVVRSAGQIQESLPIKSTPSPTDLYLGGTVSQHHNESWLLLTANIKDFPLPLYNRKGYMLLQNNTNIKLLSFLCVDRAGLLSEFE